MIIFLLWNKFEFVYIRNYIFNLCETLHLRLWKNKGSYELFKKNFKSSDCPLFNEIISEKVLKMLQWLPKNWLHFLLSNHNLHKDAQHVLLVFYRRSKKIVEKMKSKKKRIKITFKLYNILRSRHQENIPEIKKKLNTRD